MRKGCLWIIAGFTLILIAMALFTLYGFMFGPGFDP